MHKGIGKSFVLIIYAVWESLEHYKNAVNKILFGSEPRSRLLKYDDNSLVIRHIYSRLLFQEYVVESK